MESERHEIIKLIGKGQTGGVYEALDKALNRTVAKRRFFDIAGEDQQAVWANEFTTEAQKLCSLKEPGITTVYDAGVDEDGAYIVSQHVEGRALNIVIKDGPMEEFTVYQMVKEVLQALSVAHKNNYIHGSLNITSIIQVPMPNEEHRSVIVDLGLQRLVKLIQGDEYDYTRLSDPTVMAPEQFDGSSPTITSDLYSLGQIAYTCLLGGHPLAGKSVEDAAILHKEGGLNSISRYRNDTHKEFRDWIYKLITPNPSKRPQSADEAIALLPKITKPAIITDETEISTNQEPTMHMEKPTTPPSTSAIPAVPKDTSSQPIKSPILQQATPLTGEIQKPEEQAQAAAIQTSTKPANAKNKKNSGLILIIGLATVLVAITVAIFLMPNAEDNPTSSSGDDKAEGISYSFEIDEIKFITSHERKRYTLKTEILDYLLVNKTNLNDCIEKVTGNNSYLNKIEFTPDIIPNNPSNPLLHFRETLNSAWVYPIVNMSTRVQPFTSDSGYIITGKTPKNHTGDLKFKCFLQLRNCNPRISFKYQDGLNTGNDSYIMPTKNGLYQVTINVANSAPNQDFEITIKHAESRFEDNSTIEAITLHSVAVMPIGEL